MMLMIKNNKSLYYIYLCIVITIGFLVNIDYLVEGYDKGFGFIFMI